MRGSYFHTPTSRVLNCAYLCLLQLADGHASVTVSRVGKHLVLSRRHSVRGHRVQTMEYTALSNGLVQCLELCLFMPFAVS